MSGFFSKFFCCAWSDEPTGATATSAQQAEGSRAPVGSAPLRSERSNRHQIQSSEVSGQSVVPSRTSQKYARNSTNSTNDRTRRADAPPSPSSTEPIPDEEVEAEMKGRRSSVQLSTRSSRSLTNDSLPNMINLSATRHNSQVYENDGDTSHPIPPPSPTGSETGSVNTRSSADSGSGGGHAFMATMRPVPGLSPSPHSNTRGFDLLPPIKRALRGRKCLVLDLDETLVHSSFKFMPSADFVIPVDIDGIIHDVFVEKRPGVDEFLAIVCDLFEVVVFTASVAKYSDPLLDHLDPVGRVHHRLFRESCTNFNGNFVKNLAQLGRPLHDVIIIDNSPASYVMQPQHAVPISSWYSDIHDNELLEMLPFLRDLAEAKVPDVTLILETVVEDHP